MTKDKSFKTPLERTLRKLSAGEIKLVVKTNPKDAHEPEERPGFHIHSGWQIQTCLKGRFMVGFDDHTVSVTPTQYLMIAPYTAHTPLLFDTSCPRNKVDLMQLHFVANRCRLRHKGVKVDHEMSLSTDGFQMLCRLLGNTPAATAEQIVLTLALKQTPDVRKYVRGWLMVLFSSMVCVFKGNPLSSRTPEEQLIQKAMQFIHSNYGRHDLTSRQVARATGVSLNHLSRLFRNITKQSLWNTVINVRLDNAHRLLRENKRSIKEVAFLTGWKNQLYFSTVYRKHYRISPSETAQWKVLGAGPTRSEFFC